jgi:copper(I)-binding protein
MHERQGSPGTPGGPALAPRRWTAIRAAVAACALLVGGPALAGCAQKAAAAASIEVGTAYVEVPTSGTSDGGQVTFRTPVRPGGAVMRTVRDIAIPADTLLRLSPDASHLLITGAGPMKGGTQITLTLTFAKGGTISVEAEVTNPSSGGSSYFLN